jgi:hypothetical protein
MYTHPELMRAVYQARSEDLTRRVESVKRRKARTDRRIATERIAPRFRSATGSIRSAAVRSP